ncbi:hypothetical protein BX616_000829 [Lobosporangium transversale]|uniref:GLTSCR protein conserved domain-containing protein n=1 Tax=Lobosporangium transversale TaxID=64571 RepID=A0A1Y2H0F3_9FUNG|nr:hypothetical protein BCR41DRAFT_418997 [Lobosporangium transversale]KAF9919141.1 hypothetical protein BX616_000829 [Lobosporangium transversale]ORZ28039.1 hypothetical protein BCR41DRAFT_418997 [Lobosporangium transversale]|eukprot:XP_021885742.1 hypothetical protein BCR41DRAFT_418997 [Lobosporangium transversale]
MATPNTPTIPPVATGSEGETVTHIQMAGLTVLMIKTKDQVIYKLPDNMSVQSLSKEQRDRLLAEINLLHHQQNTVQNIATAQAKTQTQTQTQQGQVQSQQQQAQSQGNRPIAPLGQMNNSPGPSPSTPSASSPTTPTTPTSSSALDGSLKTTRRYNKTGKYSKKKHVLQTSDQNDDHKGSTVGSSTLGSGQPYPTPQSKSKTTTTAVAGQGSQALVFNNTSPQAYQALATASTTPSSPAKAPSSILQQQNASGGLSTQDQKRQFKLLQDIHQLHQQLEVQQASTNTFREHQLTIQRVLAQNKPVDTRTQQLAKQNLLDAEKALELLRAQLKDKEAMFRQQFPVASQQLLLLQQQQQLQAAAAAAAAAAKNTVGTTPTASGAAGTAQDPSFPSFSTTSKATSEADGPRAVEERLQQQIAEHHDNVRASMALEIQKTHKEVRRPDYRTPFSSLHDAIERLLPFHVFQYPPQDIEAHATAFANRSKADLDTRALMIHRKAHDLYKRYNNLVKTNATKPTNTSPSNALDIVALRCSLEDEREEHKKVSDENELIQSQARSLKEELERRQFQLLQQRKAEAALIEQQQKLILERQRQEELEKKQLEQQQQQMMAQIQQIRELQQHQQVKDQTKNAQLTEEQEAERRKEEERRKMEALHQQELEKQMRIKQEQMMQEQHQLEEAARLAAAASTSTSSSTSTSITPKSSTM